MGFVQAISRFLSKALRNGTAPCALLFALAGCSDGAEEAAAAGAMAQQHLDVGDLAAAKRSISEALAARDDIVELHLLKGRIELAAGAPGGAYDAYNTALSLDRSNAEALQAVSQLGLSTGHLQESLEATERILTLAPRQPDALLIRGLHALIRRRFDEAIGFADQILADQAGHENASILKARALFMKGDTEQALAVVSSGAGSESDSTGTALTKLEIYRELRRPDEMERQFARLRQLRPDDLNLRIDEANLLFKLDRRPAAHELVVQVLLHEDAPPDAVEQALRLWWEYGARDVPDRQFELVSLSGAPRPKQDLTRFLIEQRMFPQANKILGSLQGEDRLKLSARLFAARGDFERARRAADAVLGRDDTDCDALLARSEAQLGLGDPTAALRDGQHAASECPNQVAAWLAAARAYAALGRANGVDRIYIQAMDVNPQDLRLTKAYADWLMRAGREREAVATARRFVRNSPASLQGWLHYQSSCQSAGADCDRQAARGLEDARTRFGVDLEPGAQAPNGLFGRFVSR